MSASTGFLDRTLRQMRRAWRFAAAASTDELKGQVSADLPDAELPLVRQHIDACLQDRGGEVSARARAARLGELYLDLSPVGRERFLNLLACDYDVPADAVAELIAEWREAPNSTARFRIQGKLRQALEPPRTTLLRQFNGLDAGVKFLVDLRSDLRAHVRSSKPMAALDKDLRDLLASWFDIGFLDLRRITWETPAALLEKLIAYEAVHAIISWDDLKNRLAEDRRCFAFFHPRMPDEPLIFVQVALVKGMSADVRTLLDESAPLEDPLAADAAIFYSISNCQNGLAGVSFGNFLIKRVAAALASDLPNIKTFATLSPVPGFSGWLRGTLDEEPARIADGPVPPVLQEVTQASDWSGVLRCILDDSTLWVDHVDAEAALKPVLMRACADYLLNARRGERARDPVAHFHLSNGARIERLNWLGDLSDEGMKRSSGLMVNYLYKLDEVDNNHEAYSGDGKIVANASVTKLMKT
jgi:malonyl-CoA decarboxylase